MITVTYHRHNNEVVVKGHANSGEKGHDLICASVSILVYTLASFVENMYEAGQAPEPLILLEEGNAWIISNQKHTLKPPVTLVFDSICAGFELLAKNYPNNITYEIT